MKKFVLDSEDLTEDFFEDAKLYGISTSLRNYKLCLMLNKQFGYDFRCSNEKSIKLFKKNREYAFTVYQYGVPNTNTSLFIYVNADDGEYLLPEMKMMDYILLIKGGGFMPAVENYEPLIHAMKIIPNIRMISEVMPEQINSKSNLIF